MKKLLTVIGLLVLAVAVSPVVNAAEITLTVGPGGTAGDHILGEFIPTLTAGGQVNRDLVILNDILSLGLGARTGSSVDPEYYRSTTSFPGVSVGSTATATGAIFASGAGITVTTTTATITLPSGFMYLVAAWDGPNGGAEAWYVGDLAAGTVIQMPRYAYPVPACDPGGPCGAWPQDLADGSTSGQYGMTTWTLFNPTTVPDGGTTVALLGGALLGLGLLRRKLGH